MLCDVYGHLLSFDGHDFFGRIWCWVLLVEFVVEPEVLVLGTVPTEGKYNMND